jgi:hypothetical protein
MPNLKITSVCKEHFDLVEVPVPLLSSLMTPPEPLFVKSTMESHNNASLGACGVSSVGFWYTGSRWFFWLYFRFRFFLFFYVDDRLKGKK